MTRRLFASRTVLATCAGAAGLSVDPARSAAADLLRKSVGREIAIPSSTLGQTAVKPQGNNQDFASTASAEAAAIASVQAYLRTAGYSLPGDGGGALYRRTASEPSHPGKFKSADGSWWELCEQIVHPEMFGAAGGSDDTLAVQNALDYAAAVRGKVHGRADRKYAVSSVTVKNGVQEVKARFIGRSDSPGRITRGILHLDGPTSSAGPSVEGCRLEVEVDMSAGSPIAGLTGVYGDAPVRCVFDHCYVHGMVEGSKFGILLNHSPVGNDIINCTVEGSHDPAVTQNMISLQGNPIKSGGYLPVGAAKRATMPASHNRIIGNKVSGGSYAIILGGAEFNVVSDNVFTGQNHRGVYLGPSAWHNEVIGNIIENFLSSAVLAGYASSYNTIVGNHCFCNPAFWGHTGEAVININTGSTYNFVGSNRIDANKNYGIYMGAQVSGNTAEGNFIQNYSYAAICIDSDWMRLPPSPSVARPNYGPPKNVDPAAVSWAFDHTEHVSIIGNTIGAPSSSTPHPRHAAIALNQIGTRCALRKCAIQGNAVIDDATLLYYLDVYEAESGLLSDCKLKDNLFAQKLPDKIRLPRGLAHFNSVSGNDLIDDGLVVASSDAPFTITPGTTAPHILHTGILTADRIATLSVVGASHGRKVRITRSGGGAFNLDVHDALAGPVKTLSAGTWGEFEFNAVTGTWFLSAYGSL